MNIIAVINQKGGCGKTTVTINLAALLADQGQRVLVIDADPQAHSSLGLGHLRCDTAGIFEAITGTVPVRECIISDQLPGLDLLPGSISMAALEHALAEVSERHRQLEFLIDSLDDIYDYVIVDCPPALGLISINAMGAATSILVPVDMSVFALDGIYRLEDTVAMVNERKGWTTPYHILPTMVDERTRMSREFLAQLQDLYGDHLLESRIRQTVRLKESLLRSQPILYFDKHSPVLDDFRALALELISLCDTQPESAHPPEHEAQWQPEPTYTPSASVYRELRDH